MTRYIPNRPYETEASAAAAMAAVDDSDPFTRARLRTELAHRCCPLAQRPSDLHTTAERLAKKRQEFAEQLYNERLTAAGRKARGD